MMGRGKYPVRLAQGERERLQQLIRGGKSPARKTARARILLKADEGWSAPKVAEALDISVGTAFRTKLKNSDISPPSSRPQTSTTGVLMYTWLLLANQVKLRLRWRAR